ncbi:talin rod domain-containing protein 1-like [Lethenteron reissneri]|uniref:talin rod domain-containing protein 1-like n=1 Tax=Lethenteron reissneri TaxID=7753 RepID=UPI002AB6F852|nr:talin rod domain-containing protein 1-like [Lethenteron reissneri]XP_061413916.1 talin rod domain-containing protein 1-like [Lethenteron reissneri]
MATGSSSSSAGRSSPSQLRRLLQVSEASATRMQAVADLLLLASEIRPVLSGPAEGPGAEAVEPHAEQLAYERCKESIALCAKNLEILIFDVQTHLYMGRYAQVCDSLASTAELVVALTERAAHAGYLAAMGTADSQPAGPGHLDRYGLCRAHLELERSWTRLRDTPICELNSRELMDVSTSISRNLRMLSEPCLAASEQVDEPFVREQLRLGIKCVTSSATALIACIRAFKEQPGELSHRRCVLFGAPLLESVQALLGLCAEPVLQGTGAVLSPQGRAIHTSVLGGAMSVVAACVLLCRGVRGVAQQPEGRRLPELRHKLQRAACAASHGCTLLLHALRDALQPTSMDANGINLL